MFMYYNIHACGGGVDLAAPTARRRPSSGAAPLLPLGPAGMFSILALSQTNEAVKSRMRRRGPLIRLFNIVFWFGLKLVVW